MKRKSFFYLILIILLAGTLRFYNLADNPPAPYWEEAALGYDAYSILKTGKDFHGNNWPLVAFESFGDWKPSLYFYAVVPAVAGFGLNTFAVRFPSAAAGTLTVVLVYFLAKELFYLKRKKETLSSQEMFILSEEKKSKLGWGISRTDISFVTGGFSLAFASFPSRF